MPCTLTLIVRVHAAGAALAHAYTIWHDGDVTTAAFPTRGRAASGRPGVAIGAIESNGGVRACAPCAATAAAAAIAAAQRRLSGGGRCGDGRPVLSIAPVSCPALGSQRAARLERWHGGFGDGCAAAEHAPCWLIFPPLRASGGPEIFEVRSSKAVLGQFGAAEHDGTGPDGQFCRWR